MIGQRGRRIPVKLGLPRADDSPASQIPVFTQGILTAQARHSIDPRRAVALASAAERAAFQGQFCACVPEPSPANHVEVAPVALEHTVPGAKEPRERGGLDIDAPAEKAILRVAPRGKLRIHHIPDQAESFVARLNGAHESQIQIADDVAEPGIQPGRRLPELSDLAPDARRPGIRAGIDTPLCGRVRLLFHQRADRQAVLGKGNVGRPQCHAYGDQRKGNRFHGDLAQRRYGQA
ncbi:hypothetical protein D3C71_1382440 [compost metagenome]